MSETVGSGPGGNVVHEQLLPSQLLIRDLSTELLAQNRPYIIVELLAVTDATALRDRLRTTSLEDVLVGPGQDLTPDPEKHSGYGHPVVKPGVDSTLITTSFGTHGSHIPKQRFIPAERAHEYNGPNEHAIQLPNGTIIEYPGKYDWRGSVYLTFWYNTPHGKIGERLAVSTTHASPGEMPAVESSVVIPGKRPGDNYTAWPRLARPAASETEVSIVLDTVRALHDAGKLS